MIRRHFHRASAQIGDLGEGGETGGGTQLEWDTALPVQPSMGTVNRPVPLGKLDLDVAGERGIAARSVFASNNIADIMAEMAVSRSCSDAP